MSFSRAAAPLALAAQALRFWSKRSARKSLGGAVHGPDVLYWSTLYDDRRPELASRWRALVARPARRQAVAALAPDPWRPVRAIRAAFDAMHMCDSINDIKA
jgi:hypothetical protein